MGQELRQDLAAEKLARKLRRPAKPWARRRKRRRTPSIHASQIWGDDDLQREDRPTGGGGPYQYVLVDIFYGNFDGTTAVEKNILVS